MSILFEFFFVETSLSFFCRNKFEFFLVVSLVVSSRNKFEFLFVETSLSFFLSKQIMHVLLVETDNACIIS